MHRGKLELITEGTAGAVTIPFMVLLLLVEILVSD